MAIVKPQEQQEKKIPERLEQVFDHALQYQFLAKQFEEQFKTEKAGVIDEVGEDKVFQLKVGETVRFRTGYLISYPNPWAKVQEVDAAELLRRVKAGTVSDTLFLSFIQKLDGEAVAKLDPALVTEKVDPSKPEIAFTFKSDNENKARLKTQFAGVLAVLEASRPVPVEENVTLTPVPVLEEPKKGKGKKAKKAA